MEIIAERRKERQRLELKSEDCMANFFFLVFSALLSVGDCLGLFFFTLSQKEYCVFEGVDVIVSEGA